MKNYLYEVEKEKDAILARMAKEDIADCLSVQGLTFVRLFGISKYDENAIDFDIVNSENYRAPHTAEEKAECEKLAREYYDTCYSCVKKGEFGLKKCTHDISALNEYYGWKMAPVD